MISVKNIISDRVFSVSNTQNHDVQLHDSSRNKKCILESLNENHVANKYEEANQRYKT